MYPGPTPPEPTGAINGDIIEYPADYRWDVTQEQRARLDATGDETPLRYRDDETARRARTVLGITDAEVGL